MKLYSFGNVFIREDRVNTIVSKLDSTIEIWEALTEDMNNTKEMADVAIFIEFLEDIKKAGTS